ncbi:hypothetical protein BSKO_04186 [Bryopsis sp. KO-2023]|nr:hypothetical protein BSKO_04186 [Bryopsis sp. KO-2023]
MEFGRDISEKKTQKNKLSDFQFVWKPVVRISSLWRKDGVFRGARKEMGISGSLEKNFNKLCRRLNALDGKSDKQIPGLLLCLTGRIIIQVLALRSHHGDFRSRWKS